MTRPPTAGTTDRPRRPALIVKAQSAPGTTMSTSATIQNAAIELIAMGSSPLAGHAGGLPKVAVWRKTIGDRREGAFNFLHSWLRSWNDLPHGCDRPEDSCGASSGRATDHHRFGAAGR